jgi:hypothetical protein
VKVRYAAGVARGKLARTAFALTSLSAAACATVVVVEAEPSGGAGGSSPAATADQSTSAASSGGLGIASVCGNGKLEPGEECDDGSSNSCGPDAETCTCKCRPPRCGDGIHQYGEECDFGPKNSNEGWSSCTVGCTCNLGCSKAKLFKAVIANMENPTDTVGPGLPASWTYKGYTGLQAGKALCQDVGADHVCTLGEVRGADLKGELAGLPMNQTYWLRRVAPASDKLHPNIPCTTNADCPGSGDTEICDVPAQHCAWRPDPAARCNDWTSTGDAYDGEWFERYDPSSPFAAGGVHIGGMSYHFDANVTTACHDPTKLGCAGPCEDVKRSILCCFPQCCPTYW